MKNTYKIIALFSIAIATILFLVVDAYAARLIVYNVVVIDKDYQPVTMTPAYASIVPQRHTSTTVYDKTKEKYLLNIEYANGEINAIECPAELYNAKQIGDVVYYVKKSGFFTGIDWGKEVL